MASLASSARPSALQPARLGARKLSSVRRAGALLDAGRAGARSCGRSHRAIRAQASRNRGVNGLGERTVPSSCHLAARHDALTSLLRQPGCQGCMHGSHAPYVQADGVVNAAAAAAPPARPAAPAPPPVAPPQPGTKVSPLVVKLQEAIQFCGAASGVPLEGPLASAGDASVVRAAVAGGPGGQLAGGATRLYRQAHQEGPWTRVCCEILFRASTWLLRLRLACLQAMLRPPRCTCGGGRRAAPWCWPSRLPTSWTGW